MNSKGNSVNRSPATSVASTSILQFLFALVMSPLLALEHWRRQQQVSTQFGHIDMHTLRDAGISEAQRFLEVNRPFH